MSFARNQWYVAAWSTDVGRQPLGRVICNEPVVLYRRQDGSIAALEDICPHRLLPLSMGLIEGDSIRCKYHGLLLDSDGRCQEMPGGDAVNAAVKVPPYVVAERYHFVWIWIGDPALADTSLLPDLWMNEADGWRVGGDTYHVKCDYRLIIDNLMDLTHETYVHSSTVGQKELHDFPIETRTEASCVITSRWMPNVMPPPLYREQLDGYDGAVDRWQICYYLPPSGVIIDVGVAPVEEGLTLEDHDSARIRSFVLDFVTPETDGTCHYFWGSARNRFLDDDERFDAITRQQGAVFMEDVEILEAQQRMIDHCPGRKLRAFKVDAGGVRARLMLDKLVAAGA
ncbi:MAG: Rieske (2Fe-2S) protein [Sphingopyxis macrogoltabida]|uniref:Rieske (2Fe-2S) protein n=1 Tax=Sphingopyxis macrogoltabida TaxID=33050 RepID=A0A2W5KZZ7_SPHMC|nr:MAG: Rieske (2Fe-2S) protein [Sphingopyxis macrogoltabida]